MNKVDEVVPFPMPGEWPYDRREGNLQARSPLKGSITEPRIAWQEFVGAIETLMVVSPADTNSVIEVPAKRLSAESDEQRHQRWGIVPSLGKIEGKLQPILRTTDTTYANILPDSAGLEKLYFGAYDGGNRRGRLLTWQDGKWIEIWRTEESWPIWQWHPSPLVGDFDGDGRLEVAYLPWYELVIRDAQTGEKKDTVDFRTEISGRSYGFMGFYDLNGDGKKEFVIQADFPKHIDVLGYRDDKLSLLWKCEFEKSVVLQQKAHVVNPNCVADVDGDGKAEVLALILNDVGDWRWKINVYDGMTGRVKMELFDEYLCGVVDVNGDGVCELLIQEARNPVPEPFGVIKVLSLKNNRSETLWELSDAAWERWERPLPMNATWTTGNSAADRRDVLFRMIEDCATVVIRKRAKDLRNAISLSVASWKERSFHDYMIVEGLRLEALALDDNRNVLVRILSPPEERTGVSIESGETQSILSYRKGFTNGLPIVAWEKGVSRPTVIVRSSRQELVAFYPPCGKEATVKRCYIYGWGQMVAKGSVIADLHGDGSRQHIYATCAPIGCARLIAACLDGRELWHRDFKKVMGSRSREDTDGISDLINWQVGYFTNSNRQDVIVTVRRSIHTSEESFMLSGLDGSEIWHRNQQHTVHYHRGIGGNRFTIADYDGDGFDDLLTTYWSHFHILQGDSGDNLIYLNAIENQIDGCPPKEGIDSNAVAVDFDDGQVSLASASGLMRPDGTFLWRDSNAIQGSYPLCGDFDGDGKLEILKSSTEESIVCCELATGAAKWSLADTILPLDVSVSVDIDSDGRDEALIVTNQTLICLGTGADGISGIIKWQFKLPSPVGPPIIADLDGSGTASILLAGDDGYMYCIK